MKWISSEDEKPPEFDLLLICETYENEKYKPDYYLSTIEYEDVEGELAWVARDKWGEDLQIDGHIYWMRIEEPK